MADQQSPQYCRLVDDEPALDDHNLPPHRRYELVSILGVRSVESSIRMYAELDSKFEFYANA